MIEHDMEGEVELEYATPTAIERIYPWRERAALLKDFDSRISALDGIAEGLDESSVRRIELEVAIGTRDSLADLVDELRELNKAVRSLVDETLLRKTLES